MEFKDRLKKAIDYKGITQYRLAKSSGIDQGNISKMLHGKQEKASIPTLKCLADTLGVSYQWLIDGTGEMVVERSSILPPSEGVSGEAWEVIKRLSEVIHSQQLIIEELHRKKTDVKGGIAMAAAAGDGTGR